MKRCKITFYPDEKTTYVAKGSSIKDAALSEDILINFVCGGLGRCGKCQVKILSGSCPASRLDKVFINKSDLKKGWRLACATKIERDLKVFIPHSIRIENYKILSTSKSVKGISKSSSGSNFGLAFDVGTTTVAAALLDLDTGRELTVFSKPNPQAGLGADIISRINYSICDKKGLFNLRSKILACVNDIAKHLVKQARVDKDDIKKIVCVSNSVMQHLFLGVDVSGLAHEPFRLGVSNVVKGTARSFGIEVNNDAQAFFLPNIKNFVGSDCLATIIALKIYKSSDKILAIDLGTNSEVILGSKDRIWVTSTAAGPAFEGAHISCGMPAKSGAIESLSIDNSGVVISVIGNTKPIGICGSGIVDAINQLLLTNRLSKDGRLKKDFIIYKDKTKKILVTQRDVRQFQLAKAAIYSGVEILKKICDAKDKDIRHVFIAGAFGTFMNPASLKNIGIIPKDLNKKLRFVGNTALAGAKMVLVSDKLLNEAVKLAKEIGHVSLNKVSDFQEEFVKAMKF